MDGINLFRPFRARINLPSAQGLRSLRSLHPWLLSFALSALRAHFFNSPQNPVWSVDFKFPLEEKNIHETWIRSGCSCGCIRTFVNTRRAQRAKCYFTDTLVDDHSS